MHPLLYCDNMGEGGKMTQVQKEKFDIDKFIKEYLDQVAPNSFIEKIKSNKDIKLLRSDKEGIIIEFKDETSRNKFFDSLDKGYKAEKYYRFGIKISSDDFINMYREEAEKLEREKQIIEEIKPEEIEISSVPVTEIKSSTQSIEASISDMENVLDKLEPESKDKSKKLRTFIEWSKEYFEDTKTVLRFAKDYFSGKYKDEKLKAEETRQKLIQTLSEKNKELIQKLNEVRKELAVEKEENKLKIAELEKKQQDILKQQEYLLSLLKGKGQIEPEAKKPEPEEKKTSTSKKKTEKNVTNYVIDKEDKSISLLNDDTAKKFLSIKEINSNIKNLSPTVRVTLFVSDQKTINNIAESILGKNPDISSLEIGKYQISGKQLKNVGINNIDLIFVSFECVYEQNTNKLKELKITIEKYSPEKKKVK